MRVVFLPVRFSMAAYDILRSNKTSIVATLCADHTLILNKVYEKELITAREYNKLRSINKLDVEGHVVALVDTIMNKGEDKCQIFLNLLQTDKDIQETYPELKNILEKGNCLLPHPVQASSVENIGTLTCIQMTNTHAKCVLL